MQDKLDLTDEHILRGMYEHGIDQDTVTEVYWIVLRNELLKRRE